MKSPIDSNTRENAPVNSPAVSGLHTPCIVPPVMAACFVESESFTDEVLRVADDEALARFEAELAANPEAGDLIPQSGGLRIAQMKLTRRNRNGTHHVIYLWLQKSRRAVLLLFMFYTNGKQAHVPPTLFAKLCAEVATIKAHYET